MSGELRGHSIGGWSFPDARPVQSPGSTVFRYWRNSNWKWGGGLSSCWNMNVGMFCSCGISHSCNMSRYAMPASNGFFGKEEWTVHLLTGDCTKHIEFRRVTLMLHIGMRVLRSPYSDIATIYCTADVECRFVTELHLFQKMIIGTH